MILLDAGGLFAFLDVSDRFHDPAARVIDAEPGPFVLSPFVLAELDYFVLDRLGVEAELALLRDVEESRYQLEPFETAEIGAARQIVENYGDLGIGLADASIVVLADRYDTHRVLTLDERHFRALRRADGSSFNLLPGDAG